ncbi:hypothetical protein [Acidisphaera rubrifaciens]|uniref:PhnA-like protein n=1 Tax=Acidisphaera rubrifaciens HS-AP3 TaxID=1231350 RepID=A0A0D6P6N6_9PROT|nr:hypothetical protein [Acidisphaera rubrifaciens]GAN77322.1 hypothetical protein Asru_0284_02 [Acidisphaera rubrifaciens HS-AP3]
MSASLQAPGTVALADSAARPRVSWPAIFAGVVLAVAVEAALGMLGAGIGLGLAAPAQNPDAATLGTGGAIWALASTVIALLAGSYAAARLAGIPTRFDGVLHGLVIWAVTLLFTAWLLTSAIGGVVGGAFSLLGHTLSSAGATAGSAVSAVLPHDAASALPNAHALEQQADRLLAAPTPQDPAAMSHADAVKAIGEALPDLMAGGDRAQAARQRITAVIAAQAHISQQEAQARLNAAEQKLTAMKDQAAATARHAADRVASTASQASFLAFAGLLIGALAAALGGAMARPRVVAARTWVS